eukprot:m.104023 g.104023  ORF g.104023 m.104023 type:complete len:165 (+) comp15232_c1_seq23:2242-2736(+)
MPKLAERMLLAKQDLEQSLIQRRKQLRLARLGPRALARPVQRAPTQEMEQEPPALKSRDSSMDQEEDEATQPSRTSPVTPADRPSILSTMVKASKPVEKSAKRPRAVNPFAKRPAPAVTPTRTAEEPADNNDESQGKGCVLGQAWCAQEFVCAMTSLVCSRACI